MRSFKYRLEERQRPRQACYLYGVSHFQGVLPRSMVYMDGTDDARKLQSASRFYPCYLCFVFAVALCVLLSRQGRFAAAAGVPSLGRLPPLPRLPSSKRVCFAFQEGKRTGFDAGRLHGQNSRPFRIEEACKQASLRLHA